jgi:hypothetical protein
MIETDKKKMNTKNINVLKYKRTKKHEPKWAKCRRTSIVMVNDLRLREEIFRLRKGL